MHILTKLVTSNWYKSVLAIGCLVVIGCQSPIIPNANETDETNSMPPAEVLTRLRYASDFLNSRVAQGEITDAKAHELLSGFALQLVEYVNVKQVPPSRKWELGEIYRMAQVWDLAAISLKEALQSPESEDRRINDTLRLAFCEAKLGKPEECLRLVQTVMNAKPVDSAPILPAVLLEIVPVLKGKGYDIQLADVLVKAIYKNLSTVVDTKSEPGRNFLRAQPYHIRNAKKIAVDIYMKAGLQKQVNVVNSIPVPSVPALDAIKTE